MANRRVRIVEMIQIATGKIVGRMLGLSGEDMRGEVWMPWGVEINPGDAAATRSPLVEFQDDPDNFAALAPGATKLPPAGTVRLRPNDDVSVTVDDKTVTIRSGAAIIIDAPDLIVNDVSFIRHLHRGVQTGPGVTGPVLK